MKNPKLWSYSRHFLNVRPVYALGRWILENLPLAVGYGVTRGVTEIAYHFSPTLRRTMEANLRHVLRQTQPGLPEASLRGRARALAYRIFANRGAWFADLSVFAGRRRFEDVARFRLEGNWEAFTRARAEGRGSILASAHVGNWHGGSVVLGRMGIPLRTVIYHNHAGEGMDQGVARRGRVGHILVDGDPFTTMEIVRALRRGEAVAMLADQPWDSRWAEVPFFGRPSRFPVGPVRIARLAEVPIFPAFCVNDARLRYTATLCDPIEVRGEDPDEAEREALRKLARVMEGFVARNLPVWFNFTPVWDAP